MRTGPAGSVGTGPVGPVRTGPVGPARMGPVGPVGTGPVGPVGTGPVGPARFGSRERKRKALAGAGRQSCPSRRGHPTSGPARCLLDPDTTQLAVESVRVIATLCHLNNPWREMPWWLFASSVRGQYLRGKIHLGHFSAACFHIATIA